MEGAWGWAGSASRRKLLEAIVVGSTNGPKQRTGWDAPTHVHPEAYKCVPYREGPYIVDNDVSNDVFTMGSCIWVLNVGGRHHRPVTETTMSLNVFRQLWLEERVRGFKAKALGEGPSISFRHKGNLTVPSQQGKYHHCELGSSLPSCHAS